MRQSICARILTLLLLFTAVAGAVEADRRPVVVIPIKDMIERGLVYFVRRAMEQAEEQNAAMIVIDMDTPGGRLDATEQIIQMLTETTIPTCTFVNPNAISAGAIISMGTDRIFMAPGGRIGDAMPIMMSPLPMGGPQEMPDGLKEKAMSPTVALIRSAAQRKGHDPMVAEAMVRPELEYVIEGEVICPAGQLLTLTSQDAERLVGKEKRPLLSEGTVKDLDALMATLGVTDHPVIRAALTPPEKIARFIEGVPVSGILLALGLLFLYIEFKTPGFGFPGVTGIVLLLIWFWGHHVAGLAGFGELIILLIGGALLMIEIFVIPGFGIVGLTGIVLMITAFMMAMVEHYPGTPWYDLPSIDVQQSIINLGLSLVITFAVGAVLTRFLPKTSAFKKLTLESSVSGEAGYRASRETNEWVGKHGIAETPLRPAGIATFGDERLNVVARGAFIDKGSRIVVAEAHGNRIVVEAESTGSA